MKRRNKVGIGDKEGENKGGGGSNKGTVRRFLSRPYRRIIA